MRYQVGEKINENSRVAAIVQGRYQYASSFGVHARNVKQYAVEAEDHLVNLINECSDEQFSFTPLP